MSQPTQTSTQGIAHSSPCVCCKAGPHAGIADRDLDGYVCEPCYRNLFTAVEQLRKAEIVGCTKVTR